MTTFLMWAQKPLCPECLRLEFQSHYSRPGHISDIAVVPEMLCQGRTRLVDVLSVQRR